MNIQILKLKNNRYRFHTKFKEINNIYNKEKCFHKILSFHWKNFLQNILFILQKKFLTKILKMTANSAFSLDILFFCTTLFSTRVKTTLFSAVKIYIFKIKCINIKQSINTNDILHQI